MASIAPQFARPQLSSRTPFPQNQGRAGGLRQDAPCQNPLPSLPLRPDSIYMKYFTGISEAALRNKPDVP